MLNLLSVVVLHLRTLPMIISRKGDEVPFTKEVGC